MNIAFVCNEYPPARHGGVGSVVADLAPGLAARGHRVDVVGVYEQDGTSEDRGARVTRLRSAFIPRVSWLLDRRRLRRYLARASTEQGVELVEAPDFAGWVPARIPGAALVLRLHGPTFYFPIPLARLQKVIVGRLERRSLACADAWIAPSRFILDSITAATGLEPRHCEVIPNPVDTELFKPDVAARGEAGKLVVYAGTLTPRKGVVDVARAARTFLKKAPGSRLVFVGPPEARPGQSVRDELSEIIGPEFAPRVVFTGAVTRAEVAAWLQRATVAALPSYTETFGITWAEAMAAGCAVVGGRATSGPEVIEDGVSGVLVEPGNVDELAGTIGQLLDDDDEARRLGEAGRERVVARYSVGSVVDETESFYRSILQG